MSNNHNKNNDNSEQIDTDSLDTILETLPKPITVISAQLFENGNYQVLSDWSEFSEGMIDVFAKFMYQFFHVDGELTLIRFLGKVGEYNILRNHFCKAILEKYHQLCENGEKNDPLIRPSDALKITNMTKEPPTLME